MNDSVFPKIMTLSGHMRPKKRITTVWLARFNEWHLFFCPDCRTPIFGYLGEIIMMQPGEVQLKLPIEIACPNKDCGRRILLEGSAAEVL